MIGLNFFTFFLAIFVIWLNTAIATGIAGIWLNDKKSKIAGFAFSLGTLAGVRQSDFDDGAFGLWAGTIVGFALLWWVHFRRKTREVAHG